MSKTVLIGNNKNLNEMYALNLKMYVGTEVLVVQSENEALTLLGLIGSVDLIIDTVAASTGSSASNIEKFVVERKLSIPMMIVGGERPPNAGLIFIENPMDIGGILKAAAKTLHVTAKDMAAKNVGDLVPITASQLWGMKKAICDVFVSQVDSSGKVGHARILSANDDIPDEFHRTHDPGNEKFLIPAQYRLQFTNMFTERMIKVLSDKSLNQKDRIKLTDSSTQVAHAEMREKGLSDGVIELSQTCLKSIQKIVSTHSRLNLLLKNLMENKSGYAFSHCQMTNFVSNFLIKSMDWGSNEQQEKVSFVTFFHDIFLSHDDLCRIHSAEDLEKAALSVGISDLVNTHAQKAAELIEAFPHAPIGADVIIRQHHGTRNGVGFSKTYSQDISPLSLVFIIAEDFSGRLLKGKQGIDSGHIQAILQEMSTQYRRGKQKKLLEILEKIQF